MSDIFVFFAILNSKIKSLFNLNKTMQDDIEELKTQKSILTAGITDAVVFETAGDNTITLDKEIAKIGNNIILDNGKIKIAGDISNILISAKIQMNLKQNNGNTKNIYIHKNGTSIIDILNEVNRHVDNFRFSVSASDVLIPVAKNDIIEVKGYFGINDGIQQQNSRTYITVKEV